MAWFTSLLADYSGTVDPAWLRPAVTVADFFSPFVRSAKSYGPPKAREEYEAAIAADRKLIEDTMQSGDLLRPWWKGSYGPGRVGVAILRGEQVVKAWETAVLV